MKEEIRATLGALMPWGVSIVAHVVLIAAAFFIVWQTISNEEENKPVDNTAPLAKTPGAPMKFEKSDKEPDEGNPSTRPDIVNVNKKPPLFKGKPQYKARRMVKVPGTGIDGIGNKPGQGVAPGSLFGPIKGDPAARDIVYIIDASGSMVDVLPFVMQKLSEAMNGLKDKHRATVLVFSGSGVYELPGRRGLRPMTAAAKKAARAWTDLDQHRFKAGGRGSAHVASALKIGLSYNPQVVYLLSHNLTGGGQGATRHELSQDGLLKLIHQHNKSNPPARITTYQFLYEDPLIRQGLPGTLQRIAKETGGQYKFISQSKLLLR